MIIGVPTELKNNEHRVGLTPNSVKTLVGHGHTVKIQSNAGSAIGFTDDHYFNSGAEILGSADETYSNAELIVKVKEPTDDELQYLREDLTLFTYLHLAGDKSKAKAILETGVTGIAYETVTADNGGLPLLAPMSAIAGQLSFVVGSYHLLKPNNGMGTLIGNLDSRIVTVIGAGVAGREAISKALDNHARVKVVDLSQEKLDSLIEIYGNNNIEYIISNSNSVEDAISQSDLVIGAVYVVGKEAPIVVSKEMLAKMNQGSVMVDISIDQGGCFESSRATDHDNPTFLEDGILHYCVTNMPGAVPLTASNALNKATLPYVLELANNGILNALEKNTHLKNGLNISQGKVMHEALKGILVN
ncbi:MAG: alanine dehydrogenase [Gammaproteobacteria bacterium]